MAGAEAHLDERAAPDPEAHLDEWVVPEGRDAAAKRRADEIGDVLDGDDGEEFGARGFTLRELWKFTGPAWMVSIAYLDPGNLETDLQAGAQFGYTVSWVLLWASVLGVVIQILALRLGIVTRRHLAEHCRDEYPRPLRILLWVLSELMIVASDVPEVIGTAFAIQILSQGTIPLWGGVLLCSLSTVVFLALSGLGLTYLTTFIGSLVGVMSACFLAECVLSPPDARATIEGTLIPSLPPGSAQIAVALLGSVSCASVQHASYPVYVDWCLLFVLLIVLPRFRRDAHLGP